MLTQAPKGTQDILPKDSWRWQKIEQNMREICARAGYREIRTPMFEHTELFRRGVGDTTDVVQKEMYTFEDKGGRSITLKPEGTAGAARAFLQGKLFAEQLPCKMYYNPCPVFRYERPQNGRLRQHHQLGVEVFGAKDASCDAEVISIAKEILESNGITGMSLEINSIGCPKCRGAYHERLRAYLAPKLPSLCKTCNERYERNPMRILDCKEDEEKLQDAPAMLDLLCDECSAHFEALKKYLNAMGIEYAINPRIVRGLDYYTKTVFEFVAQTPNGKLTLCGGGRYDGLIEQLGGPATPGVGFGMGVERLLLEQDARGICLEEPRYMDVFVCTMGEEARLAGMQLICAMRKAGLKADLDHAARSMKAQFKFANKIGAPIVVVLAEDELARGVARVHDMAASVEKEVPLSDVIAACNAACEK